MSRSIVADHDWIEVLNRRWCVTCDAFQHRSHSDRPWAPRVGEVCPRIYPSKDERR